MILSFRGNSNNGRFNARVPPGRSYAKPTQTDSLRYLARRLAQEMPGRGTEPRPRCSVTTGGGGVVTKQTEMARLVCEQEAWRDHFFHLFYIYLNKLEV